MSVTSEATTTWHGSLMEGSGSVELASGTATFPVTWASRSGAASDTTTPEELIGAAHSSCYSMALSFALSNAGTPPETLTTTAAVTFVPGTGITGSHLLVQARIPGITAEAFQAAAEDAKANCPVSKALAGVPITLEATLL